jgi:hypothetical protein
MIQRSARLKRSNSFHSTISILASVLFGLSIAGSVRAEGFRLISSTERSVSFEVTVPQPDLVTEPGGLVRIRIEGYGTFSPPGAYELPGAAFRVAVPPAGEPAVTASVLESTPLGNLRLARVYGERLIGTEDGIPITERFLPSDPWSDGYLPPLVYAGVPAFMGRQRVLPVRVNPLIFDAGGVSVARRIMVTVDFGSFPKTGGVDALKRVLSGAWDRLYRDLLVNPADVERFKKPLVERSAVRGSLQDVARLKLLVPETGLYAVRADSLIASGLSQGLATDMIALKKYYFDEGEPDLRREVDIPLLVLEDGLGADSYLDGGDLIVFYILGLRDDIEAGDPDALYTNDNVVWIEEQVAGVLMAEAPAMPVGSGGPLVAFRAGTGMRTDVYYETNAVPGDRDFYFLSKPVYAYEEVSIPFTVGNPAASGTFSLTARVQGRDMENSGANLDFSVRNSTGTHLLGSGTIRYKQEITFTLEGNPAEWLVDGENELIVTCSKTWAHLLDEARVDYNALYVAIDGMLEFAVEGGIGDRHVEITNFPVNSGSLIEITDPMNPVHYELTPANFSTGSPPYTLSLLMEEAGERRFIVVTGDAWDELRITGARADTDSDLSEQAGPFTTLVIAYRDFIPYLSSYISWREGMGYRLLTADIEDVYDEFNGGLPSSDAIKRFIRYGFDHWGVEFVLFVGDGSEDHKRVYPDDGSGFRGSAPDFVPPYTYCAAVSVDYGDEVVTSDNWYSFLDPGEVSSFSSSSQAVSSAAGGDAAALDLQEFGYPDVFIGRLSVGRDMELRALITKIMRFENPAIDDTWRRRIILLADDSWSGEGGDYRYRSYEREFEQSMGRTASGIESSLPGGFEIEQLNLATWTDETHESLDEYGAAVWEEARNYTRSHATPYLMQQLNKGCLLFSFQGHANRYLLTSETVFTTITYYDDQDSLRSEHPLLFFGVGCHISQFAPQRELSQSTFYGPNGDCLSEQLLFKSGAGAVGTYASTAFEFLSQNAVFCERVHKVLFQTPPADSVPPDMGYTGAHLVLGEAVKKAEIEQIDATPYGMSQVMRHVILGDPMIGIDPGPPVMKLEADWGDGWRPVDPDSMLARNGTNDCSLRFTASDIVALGEVRLEVNAEDWTDSLTITPLNDLDKTYARSYSAEMDYTMALEKEALVYRVYTPAGREAGFLEFPMETRLRFFYNDYLEILPGVESPPEGSFRLTVAFPAYPEQEPILLIDGLRQEGIGLTVPDPLDSLRWEAAFDWTFSSGGHLLTVQVGDYLKDFPFQVTGDALAAVAFNFPNPFRDGTNIVYTLNLPVDSGKIEIYNVSGSLIRTFEIPRDKLDAATYAAPNSIYWDGRDMAGDLVANGTYLYVIAFERNGARLEITGKSVRLR